MPAVLTCFDAPKPRERRFRLGQLHASSSTLIALIKWSGSCRTDRSMNRWNTGELNGRGHAQTKPKPLTPPKPMN